MNTDKINELLKVLRSGEIEQCEGYLYVRNKMCFQGVCCEVSKLGKWVERKDYYGKILKDSAYEISSIKHQCVSFYCKEIEEMYGLEYKTTESDIKLLNEKFKLEISTTDTVNISTTVGTFMTILNDDSNMPFSEQADVLEYIYTNIMKVKL